MTGPGYLPGAIAVSWLRVHQIWDNNKGRLPSSIVSLVDDALVDWPSDSLDDSCLMRSGW